LASAGSRSTGRKKARLLGVAFLSASQLLASPNQSWQEDFCRVLRDLSAGKLGSEQKKAELPLLEVEAQASEPGLASAAALLLFAKDRPLEVLWWQKSERVSRTFVLALYLASHPRVGEVGSPDFSQASRRFRSEEAAERLEELSFVRDHLSAIATLLARTMKSLGLQHQKSYEAFESTAAGASGEPLLCVPESP
jgi:hypothetical protein